MAATYSTAAASGTHDAGATTETSGSIVVPSGAIIYAMVSSSSTVVAAPSGVVWDATGVNEAFTQIGTTISYDIYGKSTLWRLISPTAKTATVKATWGSNQEERILAIWVGTGVDTGTPNGTVYQNNGTGTGVSTGAMTTTSGKLCLSFGVGLHYVGTAWSLNSPTGTERAEASTSGVDYDVSAVQEYTATGTSTTLQWTLSASANGWASYGIELNDAAGGGSSVVSKSVFVTQAVRRASYW